MRWRDWRVVVSLLLALTALSACGGDGAGDRESPLDRALAYLPADVPLALAVDTAFEGNRHYDNAGVLLERAGLGEMVPVLKGQVGLYGNDKFEEVAKPLGNPFVVGWPDGRRLVGLPRDGEVPFVAAIETTDQEALDRLLDDEGFEEDGEAGGAQLYADPTGEPFAIEGPMVIVAGSRSQLVAALERRDDDRGLTEEALDEASEGVPEDALVRAYVDVGGLLRTRPETRNAAKAGWSGMLRTGGVGLSIGRDALTFHLNVTTDGDVLSDAPVTIDSRPPRLRGEEGIQAALRDPLQALRVLESAFGDMGTIELAPNAGGDGDEGRGTSAVVDMDAKRLILDVLRRAGNEDLEGMANDRSLRPFDRFTGSLQSSSGRLFGTFRVTLEQ